MSDSLRSLKTNERPWANRSSLRGNEQPWANRSGCSEEMSKWAIRSKKIGYKNQKSCFYYGLFTIFLFKKWANRSFPLFWWAMWVNHSGRSPKMSYVSESLRSLTKNEWPWVIRRGCSETIRDREWIVQVAHQKWANERIAHFFSKSLIRSFLGKKQAIRSENQ